MSFPTSITPAVAEKLIRFLAPLFLDVVADLAAARAAATATLLDYNTTTDQQLRLAALAIAFSFGALDALSRAVEPDLLVNQVIRLRGNANALNRAALQNETRLAKLRASIPTDLGIEPRQDLPASAETSDLLAFTRASARANASLQPAAPLSRQERRFAEARAEKSLQRQHAQERLLERAVRRAAVAARAA
jgi:hypothetical protein